MTDPIKDPIKLEQDPEFIELKKVQVKTETRKAEAEAVRHEYEAYRSKKELEAWNASADEHRIYHFFGGVDASNTLACIDVLGNWARRNKNQKLTIVFNSPGGSVIHGLALYDFLIELRQDGHTITTVARGMAASMGGILLQAGDERVVGVNSHMLIHEISSIGIGKMSELEDEMKFLKRLQDRCVAILASRSSLNKKQIETKWKRRDWWLSSEEAVELGFADKIG